MKLIYYKEKCIGCGACVIASPDIWEMSMMTGKVDLLGASFKKGVYVLAVFTIDEEQAKKSKNVCPTKAIAIQ